MSFPVQAGLALPFPVQRQQASLYETPPTPP
jgi:hypothetical protein